MRLNASYLNLSNLAWGPFEVKNDRGIDKTVTAVNNMRWAAEQNGISYLTLEEISEIIFKTRHERKNDCSTA